MTGIEPPLKNCFKVVSGFESPCSVWKCTITDILFTDRRWLWDCDRPRPRSLKRAPQESKIRADFWEGDATKRFSVKKRIFSEKGGGNSVYCGFGKDFYRKGNSVKRFGPFTQPWDSEN